MPMPGHRDRTVGQVAGASFIAAANQLRMALGRLAPGQQTKEPSEKARDRGKYTTQYNNDPVPGGNNPKPGGNVPPGAPGPDFKPRDLGPSFSEVDIFRWTQPSFSLAGVALTNVIWIVPPESPKSSQDQLERQLLLQIYGGGQYIATVPGTDQGKGP